MGELIDLQSYRQAHPARIAIHPPGAVPSECLLIRWPTNEGLNGLGLQYVLPNLKVHRRPLRLGDIFSLRRLASLGRLFFDDPHVERMWQTEDSRHRR